MKKNYFWLDDKTHLDILKKWKKTATYAYDRNCDFSVAEFLGVKFVTSEWVSSTWRYRYTIV